MIWINYVLIVYMYDQKSNNSTSNFNVEFGGMIGGYPYFP